MTNLVDILIAYIRFFFYFLSFIFFSNADKSPAEGLGILNRSGSAIEGMRPGSTPSLVRILAQKTPVKIYVAKYSYDPVQFSPNENPESELSLQAGEYLFVYGHMDEDGFYKGELMNGRTGLVPSNFVEIVPEEDLDEFYAALQITTQEQSSHNSSQVEEDEEPEVILYGPTAGVVDLEEWDNTLDDPLTYEKPEDEAASKRYRVPYPVDLRLQRRLASSAVIAWEPGDCKDTISFDVYLDKKLVTSVRPTERTKALLECVDMNLPHRVSVRNQTKTGSSRDEECTIIIGDGASLAPTELRMMGVTSTSATVRWTPSSSNCEHLVILNDDEISGQKCKPGVYRAALLNLVPGALHKVTVRVVLPDNLMESGEIDLSSIESSGRFRTRSRPLIEPPLSVQCEIGPQKGSVLVMWLPVCLSVHGSSNGKPVHGYSLYIDSVHVKNVMGASSDHCLLTTADVANIDNPRALTVRTLSVDGSESVDSLAVYFGAEVLQELLQQQFLSGSSGAKVTDKRRSATEQVSLSFQFLK